ncbi:MAG: KaiC associated regulatory domain-containing protein [Thermoplasmata archaeon]|nr:KaiC associated regulatory domain-containing protein [Thermoplasmata archaeon]
MEIIREAKGKDIDSMAEKVFMESIRIIGGLRKLIEYRNLTWLPSLAEASYVIIMKNEAIKTYKEIAYELGITEQTAKNIATADEERVKEYIINEGERPDEHIAGGLAKLAYKKIKQEGGFEESSFSKEEIEALGIDWAVHVLARIKGIDFPADEEVLKTHLEGMEIMGKRIEDILSAIEYPVKSPAELLHKIKEKLND